jgi:hypothetical protein
VASLAAPDLNVSVWQEEGGFTDANDAWISEGSCVQPYHAFYKQADLIVFLIPGKWRRTHSLVT